MLREHFGIQCTQRSEKLLALAYLNRRVDTVAVAHTLPNSDRVGAIRLAQALLGLPITVGEFLAVHTLRNGSENGRD